MTDNDGQRSGGPQAALGAETTTARGQIRVNSPSVIYGDDYIESEYGYQFAEVVGGVDDDSAPVEVEMRQQQYHLRTRRKVSKTGLLQVGWGGNNGSTVTAAVLAHRRGDDFGWETRADAHVRPSYNGSLTQTSTARMGFDKSGRDIFVPLTSILPMVDPTDLILGGWDISSASLAESMDRAKVLEPDLRRQLRDEMTNLIPLPAAYDPSFIADNQSSRANNLIDGTKSQQLARLRRDIQDFKIRNHLDFAVVVWTANSERYSEELEGINDTEENLLRAIESNHPEVSPSTLYCVASILERCPYMNGSPQNTLVPGVLEMAENHGVFVAGDDFKSGQTRMKSVLVDYLVSCGIKVKTMVTYNHLGNNDMYQLTDGVMWKPKSASKSRVIEDIVDSNGTLYRKGERPDHIVVVKYVPFLGDSKRDVSEYTSECFMGAHYTSIMHNECLDSILCSPLILDLAVLAELFSRVEYRTQTSSDYSPMYPVLSALSFFMKIPRTPTGEPAVNALARQRACLENLLRACVGLPPESSLLLQTKMPS